MPRRRSANKSSPNKKTNYNAAPAAGGDDEQVRAALQSRMEQGAFGERFRMLLQEILTGQKANGQPIGVVSSNNISGEADEEQGVSRRVRRVSGAKQAGGSRAPKTDRKGRGNMYGSVPAPPNVEADDFVPGGEYDKPETLVSQVRQLVSEKRPGADANALVRLGTPQNLSYMHHDGAVAFMASVWNDCPYCAGAKESLRDLALAMDDHNASIADPNAENRYALIIYDVKRHGNRLFAENKLGVDAVPAFHMVVPQGENLSAEPWDSANVTTERDKNGRIVKKLPVDEILGDLSHYNVQSAGQKKKLQQYRARS